MIIIWVINSPLLLKYCLALRSKTTQPLSAQATDLQVRTHSIINIYIVNIVAACALIFTA